jgi:hypothetical protein
VDGQGSTSLVFSVQTGSGADPVPSLVGTGALVLRYKAVAVRSRLLPPTDVSQADTDAVVRSHDDEHEDDSPLGCGAV